MVCKQVLYILSCVFLCQFKWTIQYQFIERCFSSRFSLPFHRGDVLFPTWRPQEERPAPVARRAYGADGGAVGGGVAAVQLQHGLEPEGSLAPAEEDVWGCFVLFFLTLLKKKCVLIVFDDSFGDLVDDFVFLMDECWGLRWIDTWWKRDVERLWPSKSLCRSRRDYTIPWDKTFWVCLPAAMK